jgi:alpha-galactosidase
VNQLTECIVAIFVSVMLFTAATAQSRPLARTPPMGWNSWNHFANKVDDASVRAQADAMVSTGNENSPT